MLSFHAAKARGSCARLALPLLSVASIVLVGHPAAALATRAQDSASHPDGSGLRIGDVVNTLGWDSLKRGEVGELDFARDRLVFVKGDTRSAIPVAAVKSFSLENTTRPLLRGMKGTAASFAPQGAGQLYSAIRLGAETLTLLYADRNQGLHAAVVVLPKGRKNDALQALASEAFERSAARGDGLPA